MTPTRKLFILIITGWLILSQLVPQLLAHAAGNAPASGQMDAQAIDSYLQAQVKANRIQGMAVAIVQGDQVVLLKGYGQAAPGKAVTPQTQFYLGSTSKAFTALAALQLVEQGKLELDAPVQQYLPWFQVADPQAAAQITLRHLLNHTSGLSEAGDPDASSYTASLDEQARLLQNVRPNAPAGSTFQYYNQNYRLVGRLIEQASGQSFGDYLQAHVFAPLGMARSASNPAGAPGLAQAYSRFFGFPLPQAQPYIPGGVPSGYLITTAEDMSHFLLAQLHNRQADGSPMLQPETLALMRTAPPGLGSEYGMGWMVLENGNTLAHGGSIENYRSFMALGLKEQVGFAILFNQNSLEDMFLEGSAIRDGLLALLNGETPSQTSYGWVGWALLSLAGADLLNHLRLFWMLPRWAHKTAGQPRGWLWLKVLVGIIFPAGIIFGLPPLVQALHGGSPSWSEPLHLMPDLIVWLLVGLSLNLLRSLLHAVTLLRQPGVSTLNLALKSAKH